MQLNRVHFSVVVLFNIFAMDSLRGMSFASSINIEVFKEPRGILRLILFILAIFAFATTVDPTMTSAFELTCPEHDKQTIKYSYSYPFMLKDDVKIKYKDCNGDDAHVSPCCNFNSAAQFYVFVGVIAFLLSLATLVLYVFFDDKWRNVEYIPIADFILAITFAVLFFVASCAWADKFSDLKYFTQPKELFYSIPDCSQGKVSGNATCTSTHGGNFATLTVSVIFGFLNTFVWGGTVWIAFKDTRWHKEFDKYAASFGISKTSQRTPATPSGVETQPELP